MLHAISRARNVSLEKALEILEKTDIDITWADKKNMDLFQSLVPHLRDWITDITKLFTCFGMDYKLNKRNYSRLILCGQGGCVNKLNKFIGNQLGIKCNRFILPVSRNVETYDYDTLLEKSPLFMSSVGAIMEKFSEEEEGEKLNFKTGFWSGILGR
ncbi:MAG: hypothetical protein KKA19_02765 [Candidatus Margulisbacteria bacterium]|nr:hypothetical protein [Candidatus Margulisiibacteriota bacterium]